MGESSEQSKPIFANLSLRELRSRRRRRLSELALAGAWIHGATGRAHDFGARLGALRTRPIEAFIAPRAVAVLNAAGFGALAVAADRLLGTGGAATVAVGLAVAATHRLIQHDTTAWNYNTLTFAATLADRRLAKLARSARIE